MSELLDAAGQVAAGVGKLPATTKGEFVEPVAVEVNEQGIAEDDMPAVPAKPSFWGKYEVPIKWVFTLIGLVYTILCNIFTPQISRPVIGFYVFAVYLFFWGKYIKPASVYQTFKHKQEGFFHSLGEKVSTLKAWKYGTIVLCALITAALSIALVTAPPNYPERAIIRDSEKGREWAVRLQALFGNFVWVALGYAVSRRRKDINWRLVWTGIMLQFAFALLVLRTQAGYDLFTLFSNLATTLIGYSSEGVKFLVNEVPPNFLGSVPATIIFFSALISVLYFWGIMTKVIWFLAKVIRWVMGDGVSGREAICAAANIFVGQTEAPLLIKPLLPFMTISEIHTVMTAGFATIAGGVFFAYVGLGIDPRALLSASVISAPASIVVSKLFLPEVPKPELPESVKEEKTKDEELDYKPEFGEEVNFMHAAANGATQGVMLALNVIGSLIAVLGLFYTADGIFSFICRSLDRDGTLPKGFGLITVFSYVGYPIAWLMGTPAEDLLIVGQVVSQKTILNEFVAYLSLSDLIKNKLIGYRAETIATYALCGFSNIASIGIQIGGIGGIAPSRKGEIASLAFSAMVAGSIACFMTASIAGMLI